MVLKVKNRNCNWLASSYITFCMAIAMHAAWFVISCIGFIYVHFHNVFTQDNFIDT